MLDMKFVRENPEAVKENIKKKFQDAKLPLVDQVLALDEENRAAVESNLKYVIPNRFNHGEKCTFSFRPLIVSDAATLEAELNGRPIWKRKFTYIKPAEMLKIDLSAEQLNEPGTLVFRLKEEA